MNQPPQPTNGLRLGELLVRAGYVTQAQVDVALHAAHEQGCKLGTALVRLGYLDRTTLARALGKLRRVMWLDPAEIERIDLDLARKLPAQAAHRWRAVPIRWLKREHHGGEVLVAFEGPPAVDAIDELSFTLGCRIIPCVAPEDLLDDCLDRIYPVPRPAAYRVVDLEAGQAAAGRGIDQSNEAVLRDCHGSLEVHPDGCALLVDEDQWRGLTSRKGVTEFVIDYVRRHHDASGQLTVRSNRQRHLLAHFTGHGRPVAATREPPGSTLGEDDPLFHQRLYASTHAMQPAARARPPESESNRARLAVVTGTPVARSQDLNRVPTRSQDLNRVPTRSQDLNRVPTRSQDLNRVPTRSQDLNRVPTRSQDLPGRSQDLPGRSQDLPGRSQDLPAARPRPNPTHRDHVRVTPLPAPPAKPQPISTQSTPLEVAAPPPSSQTKLPAAPKTQPPPLPPPDEEPSLKPKIELPAFPAPVTSILTAESDGLQESLQKALVSEPVPAPTLVPAPVPEPPAKKARRIDFVDAGKAALHAATSAEGVANILIETLAPTFAAILVLVVKHDAAMGWRGRAPDANEDLIESVIVPLGEPSVVARAKQRGEVVIEAPESDEEAVHRRLWKLLGLPAPKQVAAVPVVLKGRTVNLIYVHPRAGEELPENAQEALQELAEASQSAFARLIASKKQG